MTPYAFGRYLGMRLREKQAIGFGDIGKGFQNTGAALQQGAKDYGHQLNSFYNPWSDAFHAPAGPNASDNVIRNLGRGAMATGGAAAVAAGGIAAAPAIMGAANTTGTAVAGVGAGAASQAQKVMPTIQNTAYSATQLLGKAKPWMEASGYGVKDGLEDVGKTLHGGVPEGPFGIVPKAIDAVSSVASNVKLPTFASR